jgi:2-dehydropantoate 2-reductase
MMREAEQIANALGVTFRVGIDRRIAGAEKVGAHKTSMLQDLEQGKPSSSMRSWARSSSLAA